MLRIILILAAACQAGEIIVRDRMGEMLKAADDFGNSVAETRREKEASRRADNQERRQAQLDSITRVNDSLSAEIKRIELQMKRQQLERAYWDAVRDSVKAARAERKVRKVSEIAAEEDAKAGK